MNFGERLRLLREESNLTQAEFAEKIALGRVTINYYEGRKTIPDLDVAIRIADYFNVSLDYLSGRSAYRSQETYTVGMERAEEFVGLIEELSEKEAKELLNRLVYILTLTNEENISGEVFSEINAFLLEIEDILTIYRRSRKRLEREEWTGLQELSEEMYPLKNAVKIAACEPILEQSTIASEHLVAIFRNLYRKLRVKLTGIEKDRI